MATRKQPSTRGGQLEQQLFEAVRDAEAAPLPGARDLPLLDGLREHGGFPQNQENVLVRAGDILVESERVFTFGDAVVMQAGDPSTPDASLAWLRGGGGLDRAARGQLANLFVCRNGDQQFSPPDWFLKILLYAEPVLARLPRIRHYARRPLFDDEFVLRGPGWHPEVGILVHGPAVEPATVTPPEPDAPALERLPRHLRTLLGGFCFRDDADLVNAVALLLTGLLANHFVRDPKAIFPVDGNQPSLGKSWLVRAAGMVLDGAEPRPIVYTPDEEETYKRLCASLLGRQQSVLFFDNAKVAAGREVNSPTIEAMSMLPELSLRILGRSENHTGPNDVLWTLTMNNTRLCNDLVTRSAPIRLFHEGRPENRTFAGPNPIRYAAQNRVALLGELAGYVASWNAGGRPPGQRNHRCESWARVVGGILDVAGLPEFLANADEAASSFNTEADELTALAEAVIRHGGPYCERPVQIEE